MHKRHSMRQCATLITVSNRRLGGSRIPQPDCLTEPTWFRPLTHVLIIFYCHVINRPHRSMFQPSSASKNGYNEAAILWAYPKHASTTLSYSYSMPLLNGEILRRSTLYLTSWLRRKFSYHVILILQRQRCSNIKYISIYSTLNGSVCHSETLE